MKTRPVSRRNLLKSSILGGLGILSGTHILAQKVCNSVITGRQSLGPFFPRETTPEHPVKEDANVSDSNIYLANDNDLTFVKGQTKSAEGQKVTIYGRITDENCHPLSDATVIIWQASKTGRYNHVGDSENQSFPDPRTGKMIERKLDPHFQYWGKASTDADGKYQFDTIVPGFYPANLQQEWYRPPHIHFLVSAKGFPQLVTQMYFKGNKILDNQWIQELNEKDFLLHSPSISTEQQKKLIVEFTETFSPPGLSGRFDMTLTK